MEIITIAKRPSTHTCVTKDGQRRLDVLYTGDDTDKGRDVFAATIKHRPRIRLTIRQRTRLVQEWP